MTFMLPADAEAIARAAAIIRRGGLVAFPTETVYGLGAHALDAAAVARIFEAKGRPSYNPIIVHVPDLAAARGLARAWPEAADRLAAAFWPGPLTIVVPKAAAVPDLVTAGHGSVALRVPAHPVAQALLRAAGVPIAAPSANRSGEVSPTTAAHVAKSLDGRIDLVLDAGPSAVGIESVVIDLTGTPPALLRPGAIRADALSRIVGPLASAPVAPRPDAPRVAPGQLDRHYAPHATLHLVTTLEEALARLNDPHLPRPIGGIVHTMPDLPVDHLLRLSADAAEYGHALYDTLHRVDELGCATVLVEHAPPDPAWDGVRDRLARAATPES